MLWVLILIMLPVLTRGWAIQRLQSTVYYYPDYMAQQRIVSLTAEIVKDVELKMVILDYIQQSYQGTFDYEIGYLASSVKDLFKHMLVMYKVHCQPAPYANNTVNSESYLDLLHKFQSDYREILLLRDIYVKASDDEARRQKKERQIARFKHMRKKTQQNIKGSGPEGLSREAAEAWEHRKPKEVLGYEKEERTVRPGQSLPKDSKEWAALQKQKSTLRKGKGKVAGSMRSERLSKKKQEEEKYKALLRENFNARRGEQQHAGF